MHHLSSHSEPGCGDEGVAAVSVIRADLRCACVRKKNVYATKLQLLCTAYSLPIIAHKSSRGKLTILQSKYSPSSSPQVHCQEIFGPL